MRKYLIIGLFAAATMLFCSCEDYEVSYLPGSHWILHVDGMSEGHRLALTFDGDAMRVFDGSYSTYPFTYSGTWQYNIRDGRSLHMWRTESDEDGSYTESYDMDYSMNANETELLLVYTTFTGEEWSYRFDRR